MKTSSVPDEATDCLHQESLPTTPGDSSTNQALLAMRPPESTDQATQKILNGLDISGNSMDQVGISASKIAHSLKDVTNSEWGGLIYQNPDGSYHATPPITDNQFGGVEPEQAHALVPSWGRVVADYHSHTMPTTQAKIEIDIPNLQFNQESGWSLPAAEVRQVIPENPLGTKFSGDDKQAAYAHNRPGYMSDPDGNVRKYNPPTPSDDFDGPTEGLTELLE